MRFFLARHVPFSPSPSFIINHPIMFTSGLIGSGYCNCSNNQLVVEAVVDLDVSL